MTAVIDHYALPSWEPFIDELRNVGIPAVTTTVSPGWWLIMVPSEDPRDNVLIGAHVRGDGYEHEDSIDPKAGPTEIFVAYRRRYVDTDNAHSGLFITEDRYTVDATAASLARAVRELQELPSTGDDWTEV